MTQPARVSKVTKMAKVTPWNSDSKEDGHVASISPTPKMAKILEAKQEEETSPYVEVK